ncbi:MAG TPA: L,D-transpeptidase family protein [Pyrinomonadaceae bacterium]|nr:L,D-transpeptidase family protein [Pyrinomonadaceae bacterium]
MAMKLVVFVMLVLLGSTVSAQKRVTLTRAEIKAAEGKLSELGYWTGPVDGVLDTATKQALIAFQKWEDRPITGKLTREELEAIQQGTAPQARDLGYEHIEVDIDHQILMLVSDDDRVRVLPVSTGSGKEFIEQGEPSISYTPRGRFVVYNKTFGWEDGQIGTVYYANYISGGVAIHGYLSVPAQPASHGCIRIPMFAARKVSELTPRGTIVLVYDKVSFVSGLPWAKNPKLKQAALDMGPLQ